MEVNISITYLGKNVNMKVDFDDERLMDETYDIGKRHNREFIEEDFLENVKIEVDIPK